MLLRDVINIPYFSLDIHRAPMQCLTRTGPQLRAASDRPREETFEKYQQGGTFPTSCIAGCPFATVEERKHFYLRRTTLTILVSLRSPMLGMMVRRMMRFVRQNMGRLVVDVSKFCGRQDLGRVRLTRPVSSLCCLLGMRAHPLLDRCSWL